MIENVFKQVFRIRRFTESHDEFLVTSFHVDALIALTKAVLEAMPIEGWESMIEEELPENIKSHLDDGESIPTGFLPVLVIQRHDCDGRMVTTIEFYEKHLKIMLDIIALLQWCLSGHLAHDIVDCYVLSEDMRRKED